MTALADRSLRDLVPVLDRYRPAALAVTAVLVAVVVLPGATTGAGPSRPASFDAGTVSDGSDLAAPSDEVATGDVPAAVPAADLDVAPASPVPTPSSSFSGGRSGSSSFTPAPSSPSPVLGPAPPAPPAFDGDSFGGDDEETAPLRIVATAYASSTGGTPVPTDVPEGTLPVGTRIGQTDKTSYLRLDGVGTTLVLSEVADGRRGSEFETSPIQACQILDAGWEPGEDLSFGDAPEHDAEDCVAATMTADGNWSIPLSGFADPTDDRGLALVPTADAPLDFQVTFASTAAG